MANWQNFEFQIPRQGDRELLDGTERAFAEAGIAVSNLHVTLVMGLSFANTPASVRAEADVQRVLDADAHMIANLAFQFGGDQLWVRINRESEFRDKVLVQLTALTAQPALLTHEKAFDLTARLKRELKELTSRAALDALGAQVRDHYDMREGNLARLEATMQRILVDSANSASEARREGEEDVAARRRVLDAETAEMRQTLQTEHEARQAKLLLAEEGLQARLKTVDDAHARHARRKIREDLKTELASRATSFALTEGTQKMRAPIAQFSIFLLAIFGIGLGLHVWEMFRLLGGGGAPTAAIVALAVRQAAFAAAFGSTAIFFIRWNNRWLDQHASEEFKLKRLQLDFDRASWVVEMAMEWKEEGQGEIPSQLLERLTAKLFESPEVDKEGTNSLDRLASAVLGASAAATVELPGGSSLKLDRKSIRDLAKPNG